MDRRLRGGPPGDAGAAGGGWRRAAASTARARASMKDASSSPPGAPGRRCRGPGLESESKAASSSLPAQTTQTRLC